MSRLILSAAALACICLSTTSAQARAIIERFDDRLVISSGEAGTEKFEIEGFGGGIVEVYVDDEYYGFFLNVRRIIFNGDDDRDIFINNSEVASIQYGRGGNDILIGGYNEDRIYGDQGVDYIDGGFLNDYLDPGPDLDDGTVIGGPGDDIMIRNRYKENSPFKRYTLQQGFRNVDLGGDPMDEIRPRSAVITSTGLVYYLN